jgi:hypothetical protein
VTIPPDSKATPPLSAALGKLVTVAADGIATPRVGYDDGWRA